MKKESREEEACFLSIIEVGSVSLLFLLRGHAAHLLHHALLKSNNDIIGLPARRKLALFLVIS
jgi:hypothetical protein